MKRLLKKLLNHNVFFGRLIGWFYVHLSGLSPFRLAADDRYIAAFYHPIPSFRNHILVLPKRVVRQFCDLTDSAFLEGVLASVNTLCGRLFPGEEKLLLVNGGVKQEIQQLHFHLIDRAENPFGENRERVSIREDEDVMAVIGEQMEAHRGYTLVFKLGRGDRTLYLV